MRLFLEMAAGHGFVAVALGAFGAHGLQKRLGPLPDVAKRLEWWNTAAHYELTHAIALAVIGVLTLPTEWSETPLSLRIAGWAFFVGMLIFSGTLYTMTLTGMRWLGAITPIGGSLLLVGWAALIWFAIRVKS